MSVLTRRLETFLEKCGFTSADIALLEASASDEAYIESRILAHIEKHRLDGVDDLESAFINEGAGYYLTVHTPMDGIPNGIGLVQSKVQAMTANAKIS